MVLDKQVVFVLNCAFLLVLGLQSIIVVNANFKPPPLPAVHITISGQVSSSEAFISRSDDVYALTGNWSSKFFLEVERSNIIIDGAGFFIIGNGIGYGIVLRNVHNVSVSDVNFAKTNLGIYLENCSDVTITGCSVTGGNYGVYLNGSKNNRISDNRFSTFTGIYLDHSGSNILRSNSVEASHSSGYGLDFMVTGGTLEDYTNDVDASNLVNGESIIYWVGRQNEVVPPNASYVALINCKAIIVQNQQISHTQGILVAWTTNSTVTNNLLYVNFYGIQVLHSSGIVVNWNQIWENNGLEGGDGVNIAHSQFVTVANNQITENWNGGITCTDSSGNQIIGNSITRNWHNGISLVGGSDFNLIALNHLFNHSTNSRGAVYIEDSRNNSLVANNLTGNGCWGIQLKGNQGNNTFYGNNFMNNSYKNNRFIPGALQVSTPGTANGNSWDNGSIGNYWSDYECLDANSDGIGDSPYYINPNNQDNYPHMNVVETSKVPLTAPKLPPSMFSSPEFSVQQLPLIAVAVSAVVAVGVQIYWNKRKTSNAGVVKIRAGDKALCGGT